VLAGDLGVKKGKTILSIGYYFSEDKLIFLGWKGAK
jgi:hypothetical protein